jgi:hypothetical protein
VLEVLSQSPTVSLGNIASYLIRALDAEKSKIEESERLINQYSSETERMKVDIDRIRSS